MKNDENDDFIIFSASENHPKQYRCTPPRETIYIGGVKIMKNNKKSKKKGFSKIWKQIKSKKRIKINGIIFYSFDLDPNLKKHPYSSQNFLAGPVMKRSVSAKLVPPVPGRRQGA